MGLHYHSRRIARVLCLAEGQDALEAREVLALRIVVPAWSQSGVRVGTMGSVSRKESPQTDESARVRVYNLHDMRELVAIDPLPAASFVDTNHRDPDGPRGITDGQPHVPVRCLCIRSHSEGFVSQRHCPRQRSQQSRAAGIRYNQLFLRSDHALLAQLRLKTTKSEK